MSTRDASLAHGWTMWCVCGYSVMEEYTVLHDSVVSIHIPLLVVLKESLRLTQVRQANETRVKWNFIIARKKNEYGRTVAELLRDIDIYPVMHIVSKIHATTVCIIS